MCDCGLLAKCRHMAPLTWALAALAAERALARRLADTRPAASILAAALIVGADSQPRAALALGFGYRQGAGSTREGGAARSGCW